MVTSCFVFLVLHSYDLMLLCVRCIQVFFYLFVFLQNFCHVCSCNFVFYDLFLNVNVSVQA